MPVGRLEVGEIGEIRDGGLYSGMTSYLLRNPAR